MVIQAASHLIRSRIRLCAGVMAICLCLFWVGAANAATTPAPVQDIFALVEQKALQLAARSFSKNGGAVPDFLQTLTAQQWESIRFRNERALWKSSEVPFNVRLFHPGFIYSRAVTINVIEDGTVAPLSFDASMFQYPSKTLEERVVGKSFGFAGLELCLQAQERGDVDALLRPIASFRGATYFQSRGRHSQYGLSARGVAINTALPDGEDFPAFREFWLVKPEANATSMTLYALMDSPGVTGAYRFIITPGVSTTMDVTKKLFPRKGAPAPQKLGIAPMHSMFLFSETTGGVANDYRPEVHNSDGLLASTGENAWLWRPLANPSRLAVSTFPMENPRGFGLMQRDSNFDHYQDIAARYDRRPSLWVEPKGDWGAGRIEIISIPAKEEVNDNIIVFWVPDDIKPPPSNADMHAPQGLSFAYKLYWMTPGVTPHALGRATATRMVRENNDTVRFLIDFESEPLNALPADTGLTSIVEAPQEAPVLEKTLEKNPATGGWRLSFRARIPLREGVVQTIISAREGSPRLRFRALLKKGENIPTPLTETWTYDMPS